MSDKKWEKQDIRKIEKAIEFLKEEIKTFKVYITTIKSPDKDIIKEKKDLLRLSQKILEEQKSRENDIFDENEMLIEELLKKSEHWANWIEIIEALENDALYYEETKGEESIYCLNRLIRQYKRMITSKEQQLKEVKNVTQIKDISR